MQVQDSTVQVMGIDAGGTMTDTFFVRADGRFVVGKAQSNPGMNPGDLQFVRRCAGPLESHRGRRLSGAGDLRLFRYRDAQPHPHAQGPRRGADLQSRLRADPLHGPCPAELPRLRAGRPHPPQYPPLRRAAGSGVAHPRRHRAYRRAGQGRDPAARRRSPPGDTGTRGGRLAGHRDLPAAIPQERSQRAARPRHRQGRAGAAQVDIPSSPRWTTTRRARKAIA